MKLSLLFISAFAAWINSTAQKLDPAKWNFSVEEQNAGTATLVFHVKLDKDWHIYSQHTPDGGPLPMIYKFENGSCYERIGEVTEPVPHEDYDSTFGVKTLIFDKEITFKQKIKVNQSDCNIKGTIEYQACKEACILMDTPFVFNLKKIPGR
jgi:DsbC/DsbD-like thiol-disulfide interchange protein